MLDDRWKDAFDFSTSSFAEILQRAALTPARSPEPSPTKERPSVPTAPTVLALATATA
jgi:hypothetical protein